jgi:rhomboid protease GluP
MLNTLKEKATLETAFRDAGRAMLRPSRRGKLASRLALPGSSNTIWVDTHAVQRNNDEQMDMDQKIASDVPEVGRLSSRPHQSSARSRKSDLVVFRRSLYTATPRLVITPLLVVACVAVSVFMVCSGLPVLWPTGADLIGWGANEGSRIILRHEYWRLFTMVFIHGGLIHLIVNMWSLLVIGPLVERIYGSLAFLVLYVAAGVGGAIASVAASPMRVSVGASGAICGALGALLAFLIIHRREIPASVRKPLLLNIVGIIVFMAILGAIVPNIDQEAHLGGLAMGFFGGLLLTRPWPVVCGAWVGARRLAGSIAIAALLAGTVWAVARRGATIVPPANRFQDVAAQLTPALQEYQAIAEQMPATLILGRDRDDLSARAKHLQTIKDLTERGKANFLRMRNVKTPDQGLRSLIIDLINAQSSQLGTLEAARRYLETGDAEHVKGSEGVLSRRTASLRETQAFQEHQQSYLLKYGLIPKPAEPKP